MSSLKTGYKFPRGSFLGSLNKTYPAKVKYRVRPFLVFVQLNSLKVSFDPQKPENPGQFSKLPALLVQLKV